ncbi:M15 family metallopeptidase [Thermohalobacter berrensis]|uniref:Glycoside hydrolase n=1 Tax=Thermohalobacter berrensis TaxID=99594 RepID=A0A419SWD2_9FIRM|nr:M15 family metallopeptidase [Thermohalobacter berrensis]RKD29520.1 glycoside hydrolase [Thermohalobacter berrensis]
MKRIISFVLLLLFTIVFWFSGNKMIKNFVLNDLEKDNYIITMKRDLLSLMVAYPDYIKKIEKGFDDRVYVVMKSGKKILYDDKNKKNYSQKLNNPDIQDMMEQVYPLGEIKNLMEKNYDPGRIRVYPLLKEVYGYTQSEVQKNLVSVKVGYRYFAFNGKNNASENLNAAMQEIMLLIKRKSSIYSYIFPANGTFNYRYIAGTNRLSAHSFGIAIDLKRDKRDYWRWASNSQGQERLKQFPKEVVRIFEKNNFIWGGKWGHFDILHFEYRPELIIKSKYFSKLPPSDKPWYYGVPLDNEEVRKYIQIIDNAIK